MDLYEIEKIDFHFSKNSSSILGKLKLNSENQIVKKISQISKTHTEKIE